MKLKCPYLRYLCPCRVVSLFQSVNKWQWHAMNGIKWRWRREGDKRHKFMFSHHFHDNLAVSTRRDDNNHWIFQPAFEWNLSIERFPTHDFSFEDFPLIPKSSFLISLLRFFSTIEITANFKAMFKPQFKSLWNYNLFNIKKKSIDKNFFMGSNFFRVFLQKKFFTLRSWAIFIKLFFFEAIFLRFMTQ